MISNSTRLWSGKGPTARLVLARDSARLTLRLSTYHAGPRKILLHGSRRVRPRSGYSTCMIEEKVLARWTSGSNVSYNALERSRGRQNTDKTPRQPTLFHRGKDRTAAPCQHSAEDDFPSPHNTRHPTFYANLSFCARWDHRSSTAYAARGCSSRTASPASAGLTGSEGAEAGRLPLHHPALLPPGSRRHLPSGLVVVIYLLPGVRVVQSVICPSSQLRL